MREILFRGKSKESKKHEWYFGGYVAFNCISTIDGEIIVFSETVGQYTGLTDKNGKKIFEGDICKHRSNYSGEYIISVVTYIDGQFLAMVGNNSGFNLSDKLEVIGNIHDNPELLERSENGKS